MRYVVGFLVVLAGWAAPARAQVAVSLPLEGYYRPGRFVPVRVSGAGEVRIGAPGCVTTVVGPLGAGEVVVPFLAVSETVTALRVSGAKPVEMKAVGEGQRLIATMDAEVGAAKAVFPTEQLIGIPLELNRLEPVLAWTGVDALVLGSAGRVNNTQISTLLAGGVEIVVAGGEKPDARWPWERVKDVWVLRHEVAGPREVVRAEAYTPTYAWDRGVPAVVRGQIVLGAVVFSILAVGLSLWRGRYATVAFLGLCAVTVGIIAVVYLRGSRELKMTNTVIVTDGRLGQVDQWGWYAGLREAEMDCRVDGLTIPVFGSGRQVEKCEPRLVCDGQGRAVSYEFRLGVKESVAFVTRSVGVVGEKPTAYSPVAAGWREFVSDLYSGVGDRVEGVGSDGGSEAIYVNRERKGKKAD